MIQRIIPTQLRWLCFGSVGGEEDGGFVAQDNSAEVTNQRSQRREQVRQNASNTPDVRVVTPRSNQEDTAEDDESQREEAERELMFTANTSCSDSGWSRHVDGRSILPLNIFILTTSSSIEVACNDSCSLVEYMYLSHV